MTKGGQMNSFASIYFLLLTKFPHWLCFLDTVFVAPVPRTALFLASASSKVHGVQSVGQNWATNTNTHTHKGILLHTPPARWLLLPSYLLSPEPRRQGHRAVSRLQYLLELPDSFSAPFMFRIPAVPHAVSLTTTAHTPIWVPTQTLILLRKV